MSVVFNFDARLGLSIPTIQGSWTELDKEYQEHILAKWETIRGTIPDRVKIIEKQIESVHLQLTSEEDFERSCQLNLEMAELASIINDLWIWFRTTPTVTSATA
ncbi:hypothetical protein JCM9140_1866 [Halalkalibacter wakoensis JCM 9140]|uniref:Uncharacterized protein n=1 Tax=Halalkalibacter wakoensis JCM 9140 TaxID=1236970 RepID=W4Q1J5_9BACI|nr:hypothetical protein [Halalkalibacter wakoensis]GAE25847.1 hypothetical protein JCM9140_1866 [Halalkalibacter wakoensis JCM 9140]